MNPLATGLTMMASMLLSVLFEHVYGFADWYQALPPQKKRQVMAGALFFSAVGSMALSCYSPYSMGMECTRDGFWEVAIAFVISLGAGIVTSQETHTLTKKD